MVPSIGTRAAAKRLLGARFGVVSYLQIIFKMAKKRTLLNDGATATQQRKKSKPNENDGDKTTKRGSRSKVHLLF